MTVATSEIDGGPSLTREALIARKEAESESGYDVTRYKNRYYNESLAELVTRVSEKNRIIEYEGRLVQQIDPVFLDPQPANMFDYRAHFFAPQKNLLGQLVTTYWFNLLVIWVMTLALYIALYAELLRKALGVRVFRNANWAKGK